MSDNEPFALVEAMGARIIEVPDLPRPLLYIREHDLALIRADLSVDCRERVADRLLSAMTSSGAW